MKKILIPIACAGVLTLVSCRDFLTEKPATTLFSRHVFADYESAKTAVTGCYSKMQGQIYAGKCLSSNLLQSSAWVTTGFNPLGTSGIEIIRLATFTHDATTSLIENIYKGMYGAIAVNNDAIYGIENSGGIAPADKNRLLGEVRFLRAVSYFYVVRLWGAAPMPLAPPTSVEDAHRGKSGVEEIFSAIIEDLEFAFEHMPDIDVQERGRPCRWAAKALLAKVYAQMATSQYMFISRGGTPIDDPYQGKRDGFWKKSYDCAKEVYDRGPYKLRPNFTDLFRYRYVATEESIFEILYNSSNNGQNNWCAGTLAGQSIHTPAMTTTNDCGRTRPSRAMFYLHLDKYTSADPRLRDTYCINSYIRNSLSGTMSGSKINIYPYTEVTNSLFRFPITLKYHDPGMTTVNTGRCSWVILRYAELLLVLAEAANELGMQNEAIGYVNEILARARNSAVPVEFGEFGTSFPGDYPYPSESPADWNPDHTAQGNPWTKEMLRDSIQFERLFELGCEGQEWFDIRRRGVENFQKMARIINRYNVDTTYTVKLDSLTLRSGGREVVPEDWGVTWNDDLQRWDLLPGTKLTDRRIIVPTDEPTVRKLLLMPFPISELNYNRALTTDDQNYGY